ncbi:tetrahydrodipicolinate N-succinyltransferase N-terminal domain-containing protein [Paraburkholderia flava]|uniref:tetrahydrodipicolinate N-succinyltransferase N-terminal domain-containing protein n=1 Tax=Paraburkholderia flava TaxID=2547393 RepID=UPI00105CC6A5|nr:tetrahydrodipicolinate N-succinyltransferase N-terminal domain-containing protein [Paraburkholderia flava]
MTIRRSGHRYRDVSTGKTLDVWFPLADTPRKRSCLAEKVGVIAGDIVDVTIESLDAPPASTEEAYLRLHLLSERTVKPNEINLDGIFGLLPIIAWTSAGPVLPANVDDLRERVAADYHHLTVPSVDRFPRMTDYVVPEGVRIADADRVRLGAHLASGTTVMHEGFVNFNAGTLGEAMVEGRVTPGVTVGKNSDVGAGSSIMGTLSGGGKQRNAIGERSLLGANAGIGISLGDECIVEAGLYVTAGTKVKLPDGTIVAARQLSGQSGLLFRRNSQSGAVEVLYTDASRWGGLNASLHGNG